MRLVIELPGREHQMAFNQQRWEELLVDPMVADLPFRIETNAHGQILINPPPSGEHSYRQATILLTLSKLLAGQPLVECPVSTIDGVRAADVGWYSIERYDEVRHQQAFEKAPEICVEVLSPSNTTGQKKQLYFEAGALEVWFCRTNSMMEFFSKEQPDDFVHRSSVCPDFPKKID